MTSACHHDSQELETLLAKQDAGQPLYAYSAYVGQDAIIEECEMSNEVNEKCPKSKSLIEEQQVSNLVKSKSRARVEHVFGFMSNSMKAMYIKTIGSVRAVAKIGLTNPTYTTRCAARSSTKRVTASSSGDNYVQS